MKISGLAQCCLFIRKFATLLRNSILSLYFDKSAIMGYDRWRYLLLKSDDSCYISMHVNQRIWNCTVISMLKLAHRKIRSFLMDWRAKLTRKVEWKGFQITMPIKLFFFSGLTLLVFFNPFLHPSPTLIVVAKKHTVDGAFPRHKTVYF